MDINEQQQALEATPTTFAQEQGVDANGLAIYGNDEALPVEFFWRTVEAKDNADPNCDKKHLIQKEFIKVAFPGTTDVLMREVKPSDHRRWPRQYAMFKKHGTSRPDGTMLKDWGQITDVEINVLQGQNIHTVEQLAGTPDSAVKQIKIPGIRDLMNKAKDYVAKSETSAPLNIVQKENVELKARLDEQAAELQEIKKLLTEKNAVETPKPESKKPDAVTRAINRANKTASEK